MKFLKLLTLFLLFLFVNNLAAKPSDVLESRNKYDAIFKELAFDNEDIIWLDIKALCLVETTTLSNKATSNMGAKGVCQILPATFKEVAKQAKLNNFHIRNPQHNIYVAARYLETLYKRWGKEIRTEEAVDYYYDDEEKGYAEDEQLNFALASYNAGYGRVRKAMKKCKGTDFNTIKRCLPSQTVAYVKKVNLQRAELYSIDV